MKLLLVDDDAFLRDMYATKFTEAGDTVAVAKDGAEALQHIKNDKYDAVITDMIMPGISGPELIKAVADEGVTCVVLSNQSEESDIEKAKKAGAKGYIVKADVIPSEVVDKVHTILKK